MVVSSFTSDFIGKRYNPPARPATPGTPESAYRKRIKAEEPTVFVIDDDQAVRDSLNLLLKAAGLKVETFTNARQFLATYTGYRPGCLILDIRMPGMSGLELQECLATRNIHLPTIIITGHGDVSMAVRAIKAGALDFMEKPFSVQTLLKHVQEALAHDSQIRHQREQHQAIAARMDLLSFREREVLERVVAGQYNKVIATELGISVSTVEAHRKNVMEKLQAKSLSDLVRMLVCYRKFKKDHGLHNTENR